MIVFRCTRKLVKRIGEPALPGIPRSSTRLGDWYANELAVGRARWVLFVSQATFLPVLMPMREALILPTRFRSALEKLLTAIEVPSGAIAPEVDAEGAILVGPTASRRVVGVMNELAFHAAGALHDAPATDLLTLELRLSEIPIGGKEWVFPAEATKALLAGDKLEGDAATRVQPGPRLVAGSLAPIDAWPNFTPEARRLWGSVAGAVRLRILNNVWCATCRRGVGMQPVSGRVETGDLVVEGACLRCGDRVARVVELD